MRGPDLTGSMTVFVLFFGLSLLEAMQRRSWTGVAFWLGMGLAFLVLGRRARHP